MKTFFSSAAFPFFVIYLGIFLPDWGNAQDCVDYEDYLTVLHNVDTPGQAENVEVAGDLVFVADGYEGVQIVNTSDLATAHIISTIDTPGYSLDVAVSGDYAFIADRGMGLQVADISNPYEPLIVADLPTADFATDISLYEGLVFLTVEHEGIQIISIESPEEPIVCASVDGWGSVSAASKYLYVGCLSVRKYDISDPTNPTYIETLPVNEDPSYTYVYEVPEINGDYAYIPWYALHASEMQRQGLTIANISGSLSYVTGKSSAICNGSPCL